MQIGGTWVNDPALYPLTPTSQGGTGEWSSFTGPMDVGVAPPNWSGWAAEASGVHDEFYRALFRNLKARQAGKGTVYMRPWYEFNGDWMPYSVRNSDIANFKTAWIRMAGIARTEFPQMRLVWGTAASDKGLDLAAAWPGSEYVDVGGIDFYNNYPFVTTQAGFDAKIATGGGKGSLNLLRDFFAARGKPIAINEWSNQGAVRTASQGGGGESPQFIRSFRNWMTANSGTGPGKMLYEVQFNLWADQFEFFNGQTTSLQPLTAEEYRRLF